MTLVKFTDEKELRFQKARAFFENHMYLQTIGVLNPENTNQHLSIDGMAKIYEDYWPGVVFWFSYEKYIEA